MQVIESSNVPIKAWVDGVPFEEEAKKQLLNVAALPFVHHHVAVMPDVHFGIGATVGSVVATKGAVVPAAVGVDIGCGMAAYQTTLKASDLPDSLGAIRSQIERAVPHGFVSIPGRASKGSWQTAPAAVITRWRSLAERYRAIERKFPKICTNNPQDQLGTLGGGNHFIELCLDENQAVWVMLHSGSRGVGNRIGQFFIELAKNDMRRLAINLPDRDLAYLSEGTEHFEDYVSAVEWAQDYAAENRQAMMDTVLRVLRESLPPFTLGAQTVQCHHNYVSREHHFGEDVLVTRKGAVRARAGELGIIPGSMGARSYIVRGKGNPDSFCSCSHGAGRKMSRGEAKRRFSVEDHKKAVAGVECRVDAAVVDETPGAYKAIEDVMLAQRDLVDVVTTLKQVLCVKG
jgi:tRNA-splicing ligase RtcB (3'-phosphate/5'-hydroxy nucleic acid ligase)